MRDSIRGSHPTDPSELIQVKRFEISVGPPAAASPSVA